MCLKALFLFALALAATSLAASPPPHKLASITIPHDAHSTTAPDAAQVAAMLNRRATADVRECRSSVDALRMALPIPPPELARLILDQADSSSSGDGGGGNTAICTLTSMSLTRLAEIAEKCNGGGVVSNRTVTDTMKNTTTTTTTEEPCAASQKTGQENAAPGRVQGPTADGVVVSGLVLVVAFWLCM
ncbi:hypothetical protein PpBr36_05029 [Pyricularia pennisetigena]|uniref:hypothetical protein n=1 Tax=Pyricularia pennisetigena TaxID=1578925 RepID=UPI001154ABD6|nr:hypothetical protein PpBr36_05029 [Pyricularia pennisetigena]TLS27668.1 hypothetical protein PpBr36_05029 [Pyricularia pennisetigena]